MRKSTKNKTGLDEDLLKIATFILFDALIFHEVISNTEPVVVSLRRATRPIQLFLKDEWLKILKINYEPI
ncbi:MAG: hypothetical protein QXS54_12700, partial [Candidatus Methanomethylicaceae archaeon]